MDNSDVDNAETEQQDDQTEGDNSKEGNTETELPDDLPQRLDDEQPDGSTNESRISPSEPKRSMGH